jgi:YYY domain-containing protein
MEYGLVVVWLATYAALGLAGLPIAARLFPRAAGRGAGFALPIALALVSLVAYWLGHLAYPWPALLAGLVALAVVAVLAGVDRDALRDRRLEPAGGIALDRRAIAEVGVVFLVAFGFLVAVRAVDPAVHPGGGEKFLDFGLLQSLSRTTALPPEDVWFAGEPVRYYYGGHLIASLLGHLTGTPARYAYNLALAGFYAMLVTAAFDLAGTLAAGRGLSRRTAGVAAAFLVGVASNLQTTGRLLLGWLPADLGRSLVAGSEPSYGDLALAPRSFFYWDASRVVPGTVTEFPLFAWLNGDLHAHMTGTPFFLLGTALAAAYFRTPAGERRRRLALALGAVPLLASLGAVVNTWSFPSYFGLLFLAAAFAPADPVSLLAPVRADQVRDRVAAVVPGEAAADEVVRLGGALVLAGLAGAIAAVLAAPFLLAATGGERSIEVLAAGDRTALWRLLVVHGPFVVPFAAYLWDRLAIDRPLGVVVGVGAVAFVAGAASFPAGVVTVPLLVGGWAALRLRRAVGFETVLVLAGAGLVTVVELVYLSEQAGPGRFNTVFKTYAQVWVLWGTAAGVALPALARSPRAIVARATDRFAGDDAGAASGESGESSAVADGGAGSGSVAAPAPGSSAGTAAADPSTVRRVAVVALAALLVAGTGTYALFAVPNHFGAPGGATLDATAFVDARHPGEAAAIDWVDAREGQPNVVSAPATGVVPGEGRGHPPGMYRWGSSPAASLTGVPTVAGWYHEVGYRGADPYFDRVSDVDAIYTGEPADQARLLREYDVEYVWVGPAERARYGEAVTVDELPGVRQVHQSGTVTVYEVRPAALPGSS